MNYFDLKVGFTCNNNCIHCVITDKKGTKDLTTEEIKKIIDSVSTDKIIGFTGGEPTIRRDFIELATYAKNTGHQTALQTNGARFADWDFAEEACNIVDHVLIAIHSHLPEVHNAIVRTFGMYDETIEGFKNITKLKMACTTQTVLSKLNTETLLETYDFIQSINPGIRMNMTYPHANGNALTNSAVVCQKYSDIKPILQVCLKKYGHLLNTEAIPQCYLYPYQDVVVNFDLDLFKAEKSGIDPANKGAEFFNGEGRIENYSISQLSERRKGPKCTECVFNKDCAGVWKEYPMLFKNDFDLFPITSLDPIISSEDIAYKRLEHIEPKPLSQPEIEKRFTKKQLDQMTTVEIRKLSPSQLIPVESQEKCECDNESVYDEEAVKLINVAWGSLIINSNGNCMNRCTFCSGMNDKLDPKEKLDKTLSEIDYFIKHGTTRIEISGGDPGEFVGIAEIVKYLRQNGIKEVQLSTHGRTLKDENIVRDLKEAGVSTIRIPIYGSTAEIHNKTAQYEQTAGDAFKDSTQGIKNCTKYDIPIVGYTLINQYNKKDINNIIQLYLNLTDKGRLLNQLYIGVTFISQLDYSYTKDWILPIKDMGPYIKEVYNNHPQLPETTNFKFLDIPYCVLGEYSEIIENNFAGFPNLGKHKIDEGNRSSISDGIPHYRIKSYFDECEECDMNDVCGAVPLNEIKMFGTYGLKAIHEEGNE
jgi:MoaA/NifB/PqqE/SkfB family radical SAM enzyme